MVNGIQLTIYHSQFTIFSSMQLQPYLNFINIKAFSTMNNHSYVFLLISLNLLFRERMTIIVGY